MRTLIHCRRRHRRSLFEINESRRQCGKMRTQKWLESHPCTSMARTKKKKHFCFACRARIGHFHCRVNEMKFAGISGWQHKLKLKYTIAQ